MKSPYRVTPNAGSFVNGQRIRDAAVLAGKSPLMLSEAEAEHPLRQGYVVPFVEDEKPKSKKAD